jgi:hypothetical protein
MGFPRFLRLAVEEGSCGFTPGVAEYFDFTTVPDFKSKFSAPARMILELAENRS